MRKHFQASRDLKIMLAGETVQILSDTNIEMSWSYKYDRDALTGLITSSGMQIAVEYLSTDKRFLTLLVKK
ncbi:L-histidine N(alpha)-methyltransferase [Deltaproteobacteria bacterium]|nr:L-histidine N(alpha)-methyltransferase [Deltaproteobacteria bacterium]